jgi:hypothetical protein
MAEKTAKLLTSPVTGKINVQVYTPKGRPSGDPMDVSNDFWGLLVDTLRTRGEISIVERQQFSEDLKALTNVTVQMRGVVLKRITIKIVSEDLLANAEEAESTAKDGAV